MAWTITSWRRTLTVGRGTLEVRYEVEDIPRRVGRGGKLLGVGGAEVGVDVRQ